MSKKGYFQGIGYYVNSKAELDKINKLYKLWNSKLQKLGHTDEEFFNSNGLSSAFFVSDRSKGIYKRANYQTTFFFSLIHNYITYFVHTTAFKNLFSDNPDFFILVLSAYADGTSLPDIVELCKNSSFYKHPESGKFLRACYNKNKKRSKFYVYIKLRKLLQHCWLWNALDHNGELELCDLHTYNFLGLDIPNTIDTINELRKLQNLAPISKLGIETIKLYKQDRTLTAAQVVQSVILRDKA